MNKLLKIHPKDNVAVALEDLSKGYKYNDITLLDDVPFGHKVLLCDVKKGDNIVKYGYPIGQISYNCKKGSYIHQHNLITNLSNDYSYSFDKPKNYNPTTENITVNAYKRDNDKIGIRNEIWIIPTVGCVNKTAQVLEKIGNQMIRDNCDGVIAFTHPYGCSQMADDWLVTKKTLASLINHPNAGGVLVVSLGCENTNFDELLPYISNYDSNRVKLLVCQQTDDEIETGRKLLESLAQYVDNFKREPVNISNLKIGLKCGGSDGFSGITANALCGKISDKFNQLGATTILTEVPEMFGAEHILMSRSLDKRVFDKQVQMINDYKNYFNDNGMVCYENPSPGNHMGGITTLEEKSLGCVQKGGSSVVTDVLDYGEFALKSGLNLLYGPGNDMVSATNLTCSGANIILFTTGRGTSFGAPVPTVKISSNTPLFNKKKNWIDFNAGEIINGENIDTLSQELFDLILDIANGKKTKNEINGYRDIAIFKNGVTM